MSKKSVAVFKYPSITTPNFRHDAAIFAAEIITFRAAIVAGYTLNPFFWRKDVVCEEVYKSLFLKGIECFKKLSKRVPPHFIIQCCIYSNLKKIEYGYVTAIINKRWDTWCSRVVNRLKGMMEKKRKGIAIAEDIMVAAKEAGALDDTDASEIISALNVRPSKVRF